MCENNRIKERLPDYRDGRLESDELRNIEVHLAACEDCAMEFRLLSLMAEEQVPDPGEPYWAGLSDRVYREVLRKQPATARFTLFEGFTFPIMHRWSWATAAVIVLASLTWYLAPAQMPGGPGADLMDESAVSEVAFDDGIDMTVLSESELDDLVTWASTQYAALFADEPADLLLMATDNENEDQLEGLNVRELNRLSQMLDSRNKEG